MNVVDSISSSFNLYHFIRSSTNSIPFNGDSTVYWHQTSGSCIIGWWTPPWSRGRILYGTNNADLSLMLSLSTRAWWIDKKKKKLNYPKIIRMRNWEKKINQRRRRYLGTSHFVNCIQYFKENRSNSPCLNQLVSVKRRIKCSIFQWQKL